MTKFMLVATIASLSIVNARFAWAQAAIQEPGAYAFYHPNGDVLRAGSGQYGSRAESYGAIGVHNAMASAGRAARGHKRGRTQ
jgi:homogentisate 1,2-dioxygenase